jgi:dolichol-phosphate mannosyltransferase
MKIPILSKLPLTDTMLQDRIKKFFLVGVAAALINLAAMVFFIEVLNFNTYLLKNIANLISIEISVVFNFSFSRYWTWRDAPKRAGTAFAMQFVSFNIAAMAGMAMRSIIFAALELIGIHYIINVICGIALAAGLSFVLYDKIVFKRNVATRAGMGFIRTDNEPSLHTASDGQNLESLVIK